MSRKKSSVALTEYEKTIVLLLLSQKKKLKLKNQDILRYINMGRFDPVNSGRISEINTGKVSQIVEIVGGLATQVVADFIYKKDNYDLQTGLNPIDDERIIRAREAMCAAVENFNNPSYRFKVQSFVTMAIIAWTYLVYAYCERHNIPIVGTKKAKNGTIYHIGLTKLLDANKLPLSDGIKANLKAIIIIRNEVEHNGIGIRFQSHYDCLFQACCIDFEKMLTRWFGTSCSLQKQLLFALQFSKIALPQIKELQASKLPANIKSIDAELDKNLTEEQRNDLEYQFKVVYTCSKVAKGQSDIALKFISPESAEGEEINNVLVKKIHADNDYPFKPKTVCEKVSAVLGKNFTMHMHTNAYKKHKIRPSGKAIPHKGEVNQKYCFYHASYGQYTYNQAWIDLLIDEERAKGS